MSSGVYKWSGLTSRMIWIYSCRFYLTDFMGFIHPDFISFFKHRCLCRDLNSNFTDLLNWIYFVFRIRYKAITNNSSLYCDHVRVWQLSSVVWMRNHSWTFFRNGFKYNLHKYYLLLFDDRGLMCGLFYIFTCLDMGYIYMYEA